MIGLRHLVDREGDVAPLAGGGVLAAREAAELREDPLAQRAGQLYDGGAHGALTLFELFDRVLDCVGTLFERRR